MTIKLGKDERECILRYSEIDDVWYAESSVPRITKQFKTQGWNLVSELFCEDGTSHLAYFTGKSNLIGIKKANAKKRIMTEEQKDAARDRLSNARKLIKRNEI